jgi:hypothetical protein
LNYDFTGGTRIAVGDLDGDRCAEVVVVEPSEPNVPEPVKVGVLDGRTGAERWCWRGGGDLDRANQTRTFGFALADLRGKGAKTACLNAGVPGNYHQRLVLLDAEGQEQGQTDLGRTPPNLDAGDIDGDGRDEILIHKGGQLTCFDGDLNVRWSRPDANVRRILPGRHGKPGTVVVDPTLGLDGATGRPRWSALRSEATAFDEGRRGELTRFMSGSAQAMVCRLVVPTDATGIASLTKIVAVERTNTVDARWQRPLPWTKDGTYHGHSLVFGVGAVLALINVVIPLTILRRATRRRFWSMGLVLALPAASAVVLTSFVVFRTFFPGAREGYFNGPAVAGIMLVGSVLGLPLLVYATVALTDLARRRWRRLASLVVSTAGVSAVVGGVLIARDRRLMPPLGSFDWSGWYDLLPWGAYLVGVGLLFARPLVRLRGWLRARRQPASTG